MSRLIALALISLAPCLDATADTIDFQREIAPILNRHCIGCHGPDKREGGLDFTRPESAIRRGDSGRSSVVPGKPSSSELLRRVTTSNVDERMPLEASPLGNDEVDSIRRWIEEGAVWADDRPIGSRHWAYVQPTRPGLPPLDDYSWCANEIDCFVLDRMQNAGLAPSKPAEPAQLLRRLYLDLTGLPPSIDDVDAYLANTSPHAYEQAVDRLLSSPHYGEKWSRYWLDLARYADSNGFQADQLRDSWAYRDWVIDAMNADMPFDQFTIEQIAGDCLPNATVRQRIATGFHRTVTCNVEAGVDPEENRTNQVVDRVNTTATTWLGSTFACAQCHNHKYDPISQREYYELFAFFNNTPREVELGDGNVSFDFIGPTMELPQDAATEKRHARLQRELEQLRRQKAEKTRAAATEQASWERATLDQRSESTGTSLPTDIVDILMSDDRSPEQTHRLKSFYLDTLPEIRDLKRRIGKLSEQVKSLQPATTLVMVELESPRATNLFIRGEFLNKGPKVEPKTPSFLHTWPSGAPKNRLGLARWLVAKDNPLTRRVIVNHWWKEFFGAGLVRTPEDFGTRGQPPTHPKLLDWLADELLRQRWSMKSIHRLIVTSATYRQDSRSRSDHLDRDPNNQWLARAPRLRLSAELIRDNALAISGLLCREMHGEPNYPPQPPNLWRQIGRNEPKYVVSEDARRFRRGTYVIWRRAAPYPSFVNFDATDRASCVADRSRTNTPMQALTLLNDQAFVECAQALATRIVIETRPLKSLREKAVFAFRTCLARTPRENEMAELLDLYAQQRSRFMSSKDAAESLLKRAGRVSSTISTEQAVPWACWYYLSSVLLNLDETITKN